MSAPHASDITLVDVAAGKAFPGAPAGSVLLSSVPFGPVPFGWRGGRGWREGVLSPSDCHVLTDGEFNTPRWLHTFDQVEPVLPVAPVTRIISSARVGPILWARALHA